MCCLMPIPMHTGHRTRTPSRHHQKYIAKLKAEGMSHTIYSVDSGVVDVMRQGKDTANEYPWLKKSTIHLYKIRNSMPGGCACAYACACACACAFWSSLSLRLYIFGGVRGWQARHV